MSSEQTYTITRGLVELKTLAKRINKLTNETTFLDYHVPNKSRSHDQVERAPSNFQAIRDLTNLRNRIKYAIIASNATTDVVINGRTYKVAEAIDMKQSVTFQKNLLNRMRQARTNVRNSVESLNAQAQSKLDRLLEVEFGKGQKSDVSHITSITDAFMKSNEASLVDPLDLDKRIAELEDEVESFEREVDFALSESNATTHITV